MSQEDSLEEEMATHSNILAWEIPWTEKPGGVQSMGSQSQTRLSSHTHTKLEQEDRKDTQSRKQYVKARKRKFLPKTREPQLVNSHFPSTLCKHRAQD